ncbi:MAG: hypothetical protein H6828_07025 [Planctomycetes bacterium]|nr:hypothetical protein [Planctomycetota bacterium]
MSLLRQAAARAALALVLAAPAAAQDWPFGAGPDAQRGMTRDLYNLGLLGAKATDGVKGEPRAEGGMRRVESSGEPGPDVGPTELRIECVYPDGPAARAGLAVGDVLLGVGRAKFDDGSSGPLADELVKAFAAKKPGTLALRVRRAGETKPLVLEVAVEPLGKWFAKPTSDAARVELGRRALAWLAEHQQEDGGYAETLSGRNGAVVQTCMAGLAWIAGGSTLDAGPHAGNLAKALAYVRANLDGLKGPAMGGDANWDQENWGWVHAGIFAGELWRVSPSDDLQALVARCAAALFDNQEASGGYAHGPGGPNALGYVELNIVGGMVLSALGLAQQAGYALDEDKLDRLVGYLEASSGDGLGYSTKDGQRGLGNIGRTAAAWLGLRALGRDKSKLASSYAGYVKRNAGDVLGGHASLMQHVLFAGLAAQAQGGGAAKLYWGEVERDLVLALAPDGSLQPRPWHESLAMASNSDASLGQVWTTAAWACVLLAAPPKGEPGGLSGWLGQR